MKIVILFHGDLYESMGGNQVSTYNALKILASQVYEIHIIAKTINTESFLEMREYFLIHWLKFSRKFTYTCGTLHYFYRVLITIKEINPDLIRAQQIRTYGIIGFLICKILRKSIIIWDRGSLYYRDQKNTIYIRILVRFVLKHATKIIASTNNMKKLELKYCDREISVIPIGINSYKYKDLIMNNSRKKLGIKNEDTIIMFVGRLNPIIGVVYIIRAMEEIITYQYKIKLIIIGDRTERNVLENHTKELNFENNIEIKGIKQNKLIRYYMSSADVFILPSLREGLVNASLEAMAAGIPIVTTIAGGNPDTIINNVNGLFIKTKNSHQIALKIILLFKDNKYRNTMSKNNLKTVKDYSWKRVVDKIDEAYNSATGEKK